MYWERTEDGVKVAKYVGEAGTPTHRLLYEHTYSAAEWNKVIKAMKVPVNDGS